jgi:hypothetical protein
MCRLHSLVVVDFESAASSRTRFFRYCSDPTVIARYCANAFIIAGRRSFNARRASRS